LDFEFIDVHSIRNHAQSPFVSDFSRPIGKKIADGQTAKTVWEAKAENIGVYIDNIGLFLYGEKGGRMVVYVDDIKIEGEVPTEEAYKEALKKRWVPVKKKTDEKISYWEKALGANEAELKTLTNLSEEANGLKKEVEGKIIAVKKKVEDSKTRGYITNGQQREIDEFLEQFKDIIFNIKAVSGE